MANMELVPPLSHVLELGAGVGQLLFKLSGSGLGLFERAALGLGGGALFADDPLGIGRADGLSGVAVVGGDRVVEGAQVDVELYRGRRRRRRGQRGRWLRRAEVLFDRREGGGDQLIGPLDGGSKEALVDNVRFGSHGVPFLGHG